MLTVMHTRKETFTMNRDWKEIHGSNQIMAIAYDEKENKIYVKFNNESVYSYTGGSKALFKRFAEAPSTGSFFHKEIKKLKYTKEDA